MMSKTQQRIIQFMCISKYKNILTYISYHVAGLYLHYGDKYGSW